MEGDCNAPYYVDLSVYLESKSIMQACAKSYIEHVVGRFGIYKKLQ